MNDPGETVPELIETLDRADEHTAMLMARIEQLEENQTKMDKGLVSMVETDLAQRIEIESLKICRDDHEQRAAKLTAALADIIEYLEDREDIVDGANGQLPNTEMRLLVSLRAAMGMKS